MVDFGGVLRPGMGVWWSQAAAEPRPLVDELLAQAPKLGPLRLFTGLSWNDQLAHQMSPTDTMVSYGGLGSLRELGATDQLDVVPCHYSALPRMFAEHRLPCDAGLLQVSPPDVDGMCSLGIGVDYMADAAEHTSLLFAEINAQMPPLPGSPRIPLTRFAATLETDRPLQEESVRAPGDLDRAIAANVATLVDDGDTVQVGIGSTGAAVFDALSGHRDLGVHSGMLTDGVMRLIDKGVITGARKQVDVGLAVAGTALGSAELYARVADLPMLFRPTSYTHAPQVLSQLSSLVAVNFAIEVDLTGQVGAEMSRGTYLGAVGGQVDFARAAALTGKRSIVALRSTMRGRSSIKFALDEGVVTTARADVDCVVTEHGIAHLRGQPLAERRRRLIEIAAPEFRDELSKAVFAA
ncbi:putative 4-hydroxybutyrate CoA-transferase [Gordonia polyisoprenivorans NBRC 16320 = JCM 10675]|uniref:Acetyl-CoA hydrolase/transferase family protein n=1 Tax=Gordonia polyisoprenivorans TaxID=84595 RepID=A0A846WU15_9ACTN|nr:acetyl-CoA hydrolase/transferase C-terminal domain-containing protein [Gordonia polyisoprenivorans]NKY04436.1 acetyl-CoA hydrolase/transferase family protein [Gordonia polyisoprenivorans]WCB38938.1 acetyl-CoA hydrolase/transferase C-terminal domain-containing protein [Gordonia polyisoprenivorans]GAB25460.1 putative 4-hydroxybutyrate CoA-transferase [Gordonia polyisoprenivorans NBRC 16320 = JCM 10675]